MNRQPKIPMNRIIHNKSELVEMLKTFAPGNDSQARRTLMDGFEIIRTRLETEASLAEVDPDDFGGYPPAPLVMNPSIAMLDKFIERSMGGRRDGLVIKWLVGHETLVFDPWTGELKNA